MCTYFLHLIHSPTPFPVPPHTLIPTPLLSPLTCLPPVPVPILQFLFLPPVLPSYSPIFYKKKEKITLLLAWDKGSYVEFPCDISMYICIITTTVFSPLILFIHPYSLSSGGFSWLYFYFHSYRKNTSTIFNFLVSFFYPTPFICDPPLVCTVFHSITAFVLGQFSTYEREHVPFGLLTLANFT
jgi:hypothetical protein